MITGTVSVPRIVRVGNIPREEPIGLNNETFQFDGKRGPSLRKANSLFVDAKVGNSSTPKYLFFLLLDHSGHSLLYVHDFDIRFICLLPLTVIPSRDIVAILLSCINFGVDLTNGLGEVSSLLGTEGKSRDLLDLKFNLPGLG
jgi:hypothetical protein